MRNPSKIVAILNGNLEVTEVLEESLQNEGFKTVSALVSAVSQGKEGVFNFMKKYNPAVIIYDVPPPYESNINLLNFVKVTSGLDSECIIITSTNSKALKKVEGIDPAVEIIEKPYDLNLLIKKVQEKIKKCS